MQLQTFKRLAKGAVLPTWKRIGYACVGGAVAVAAIFVPFLNIPLILIAYPIIVGVPEITDSARHVEWTVVGPFLKSGPAFLLFYCYFVLASYLGLARLGLAALDARK